MCKMKTQTVLLLLGVVVVSQALTPSTYFTNVDKERLRSLFKLAKPYTEDFQSLHYSVQGIKLLGGNQEEGYKTCQTLKTNVKKMDNVESMFYASEAAEILKTEKHKTDCNLATGGVDQILNDAIVGQSGTQVIYQAVAARKNFGLKVDNAKVTAALDEALKKDDSPLSHGYAFHAAALLTGDLTHFHGLIEDMIPQADEIDEKYLSFEGGLHTTAVIIDGAYKLAAAAKKAPTITQEQAVKFANYFLSRKHVQSLRNAAVLLSVIKTLTTNQYHIPIAVTLASQVSVSDKFPTVQVRVSNLLGESLGNIAVTADTARHMGDDAVVLSKKPFKQASTDPTLFEYDFLQVKPARGFYKILVSVAPSQKDSRLVGLVGAEVEVKVTTQVGIESVEIGVGDREATSAPRTTKVQHPSKAPGALEADHHQKITMKFQLKDKSAHEVMTAHQAFVRLSHEKTGDEIFFVAQADNLNMYKFELDVGAKAREFGYKSGTYHLDLLIGDAVIQNPFAWTVTDVKLSFPEPTNGIAEKKDPYEKKPEIKHLFREPEKRPPTMVSNVFTGLVLVPILVMFALWIKTGANINNFPASISALGFHVGLAGIFVLYYMYFVKLDMFTTLKYLCVLGIATFLFGNRLLSSIAAKRKQ